MCYSAQIWADFRKYERFGGTLDIRGYTKLAGWTKKKGNWTKVVPKTMRRSMLDLGEVAPELFKEAAEAEISGIADITEEIDRQIERQAKARAKLASPRPTKAAENELRVSTNKIDGLQRKLDEIAAPAAADGIDRIWPGHFAPVLISDPETGERLIVPMRYRCRLPGWDEAKEIEKPGSYNARRDRLTTVWRRVFGIHHGVIGVRRFFESVNIHDLQQRDLVPGEREQKVEIVFTPRTGEDLFVACLWTYVESSGNEPGFYTFAAVTGDPPPEVAAAGHDRCIVSLREEDIEGWLNPAVHTPGELQTILDRGEANRPFYEHEIAG
ncbi:MAG: SOS response-associated peptidase family protein [Rhodanobacter sp.]